MRGSGASRSSGASLRSTPAVGESSRGDPRAERWSAAWRIAIIISWWMPAERPRTAALEGSRGSRAVLAQVEEEEWGAQPPWEKVEDLLAGAARESWMW